MFSLFGNTNILCRKWNNGRNCAYHNFQCFMYHPNLGNYLWNWLNVINNNGRIGLLNCNEYISVPILHQTWIQLNFHLKIFFLQIRYVSFWNVYECNRFLISNEQKSKQPCKMMETFLKENTQMCSVSSKKSLERKNSSSQSLKISVKAFTSV